ncbi:MAG TPA: carboxypeptidase-like regulatory domain-containing protein [Candidatus Acidoferrales bacterium]|nr:carboxypeptidase-like regulatory domain-containing protein [Candidatus Acidoferrales bacterium]
MRQFLATAVIFASTCAAQEFRATVSGRVTDSQNAVITGVKLIAVQVATEAKFETVTDSDGLYTIPFLPPATYRISADAPGFKHYVRDNVAAGANERLGIDIQMEVGAVTETLNVTAEAPILQTTTASTGQVISSAQIENMPVSGRTPLALAQLAFGVIPNTDPRFTRPFDNAGPSGFSMGGAPAQVNELLIDGAADNTGNLRVAYNPPMDAVTEVKAESFQADAAYGHSGGGTVNVITRSGSNQFHGTLYEFNQNSAFNATPFFTNKAGVKKPVSRYNQYGGSFSGPIRIPKILDGRNKVFFMFAYEGVKDALPAPTTNTMPTTAERSGDFSALLKVGAIYQIYDPSTGVVQGGRVARQPFPNNIIPANLISPIAKNYLQYYVQPNQPGQPNGQANYLSNTDGERNTFYNTIGRLDVNLSEKHKFFFGARNNLRVGSGGNGFGKSVYDNPTSGDYLQRLNWGLTFDDVYTLSPTFLMNSRLNWTRFVEPLTNFSLGYDSTSLGLPAYLSANAPRKVLPRISFPTNSFNALGDTGGVELPLDIFQIFESFTKIQGKHSLKFGVDIRQYRESQLNAGYTNGTFVFGTNWTNGPLDNSPAAPIGQDLAAFLLGLPTSGQYDLNAWRQNKNNYYSAFLQDDFRVSSSLTLNLGLRMEGETPTTERYNRTINGFDNTTPSPIAAKAIAAYAANPIPEIPAAQFKVNGGPIFAGTGNTGIYSTPKANFSPRIGFAWSPGFIAKTVIRGGAGIFYFPYGIAGNNAPGFSQTTPLVASNDGFLTPAATLANPFPNGIQTPTGSSLGLSTFLGKNITFYDPNPGYAYSTRWQVSVQRELFPNVLLELGYIGNKAVKMPVDHNFNGTPLQYLSTSPTRDQATIDRLSANVPNPFAGLLPGTGLNGSVVARSQLLAASPQYSGNTGVQGQAFTDGSSWFHALDARIEKRFSHGFLMLVNFQWSKLMEKRSRLNDNDPLLEKRIAAEDRPYRLVWSGTYDLPFGRGKALLKNSNRVVNYAAGGWNVNLITTFTTGTALGWGNMIYFGGPLNLDPHNVDNSFDVTQFNRVSAQQLASNVRTFPTRFANLRADSVQQVDFSIIKQLPITERLKMTYRCEFFNSTNRAIFNPPDLGPTSSTFGKITSQANTPRRIQMALRLVF